LKILNGRLSGNSDEPYPEEVIESVLDAINNQNDKQVMNKIIMSQKKEYYTIHEPDKLLNFIDKELKPKEKEKKENGEVFTPLSLVKEMLDKLDEAYKNEYKKSIFTEKDFKWFDPAVGIGNFPIIVYQRLMSGLATQFSDEEETRTWILEHMLYASELTPKNVFIYKKIFCGDSYKLNIYEGNTLKMNIKKEFKLPDDFQGFDVVMGNPPYNANGTKHKGDKNIYVYFSTTSFKNWLKKNGYLVFIHPPTYRISNHKIQHTQTNLNDIYTTKKILCIKMFSIAKTTQLMSVMMNVDFIIIQNTPNNMVFKSNIIDTESSEYKLVIKPNDFIPNFGLNILKKLKDKNQNGNIELKLDSEIHTQKTTGSTYKNIHGIISKGIKICMSDKKHKYFDKYKLIINGIGSYNYVFYDKKGEYGMSEKAVGIIDPTDNTNQFIQSPLFHYISNATKIIGNNFNIKTSLFLPIIPENILIKNKNDLYKYFDFTDDEISKINSYSIPKYTLQELTCDGKSLLSINSKFDLDKNIKKDTISEVYEDAYDDVEEGAEELISNTPPNTEEIPTIEEEINIQNGDTTFNTPIIEFQSIQPSFPVSKKKKITLKKGKLVIVENTPSPKSLSPPQNSPKSRSPKSPKSPKSLSLSLSHSPLNSPSPLQKSPSSSPKSRSPSKTLKKTPSPIKPTRKKPEKIKGVKLILEGGTKKYKNKIKKYTIKHKRK
jgi:hypothetical protein